MRTGPFGSRGVLLLLLLGAAAGPLGCLGKSRVACMCNVNRSNQSSTHWSIGVPTESIDGRPTHPFNPPINPPHPPHPHHPHTPTAKPTPADYADEAARILAALAPGQGPLSGQAWDRLAALTDTVGNRVSGSANNRRAVAYMLDALGAEEGLEGVAGEPVLVPHWVRGREEAVMLAPRHGYRINTLGLGTSVGTVDPEGGGEGSFAPLVADVVVVADWAELEARGKRGEVEGKVSVCMYVMEVCVCLFVSRYGPVLNYLLKIKTHTHHIHHPQIVLLNPSCDWAAQPVGCYSQLSQYRGQGASKAAEWGALACLVRSLASSSIGSPHTGMQSYAPGVTRRIPAAAVAVEDAEAMARMQARGQRITVSLYMEGAWCGVRS